MNPAAPKTGAGWIPLLESTMREVFETMLETRLRRVPDPDPPPVAEITAMLGLAGELCGVLSLHCAADTAARMASKILGVKTVEAETVRDTIAEVCNVVAGNFKCQLPRLAERCLLSLPTVISGAEYQIYAWGHGERARISFDFEGAALWVTLDLNQQAPGSPVSVFGRFPEARQSLFKSINYAPSGFSSKCESPLKNS